MPVITDKDIILNFLKGGYPDTYSRTYEFMLNLSDNEIERSHTMIQWLFPLNEYSKHADTYPILTRQITELAKQDPIILNNIKTAKIRFEKFLGIGEDSDINKQRKWCRNNNHNLLRITRIIRCLRLFDLNEEATDFYNKVTKAANYFGLNTTTLEYWNKAYIDDIWKSLQE